MGDSPRRQTIPEGPTQRSPALREAPAILADRYALEAELGRGGMGRVFAALDERLERPVAVKLLAPGVRSAEMLARFEQEARAAGVLNHPNVLTVFDAGVHEGTPFIVTELLQGSTCGRGSPPDRSAWRARPGSRHRSRAVWRRRTKKESSTAI